MISRIFPLIKNERRAMVLAVIIISQALCAMFFFADVIFDVIEGGHLDDIHLIFEAIAAVALVGGVIYLMRELADLLNRMESMDIGLRAARGEMAILIDAFFDQWKLTSSEREIARLVLKGINNDAIAEMRGTAPSTVRAQCTKIYQKAQVDGRPQLLSVFMEELFFTDMATEET